MSEDKILKIIKSTPNKSCDLDTIPTSLVLDFISVLLTPLDKYCELLTQRGQFPILFQDCTYHTLGTNTLKNYRPVFNLSYILKLIEKAVAKQINEHSAQEGIYTA